MSQPVGFRVFDNCLVDHFEHAIDLNPHHYDVDSMYRLSRIRSLWSSGQLKAR